ncbi:MAG: LacI family transcriptional regulator [Sphingobacteriaceae bacterium]|nr:MAG: LacI family transcriptional regulator [Sphingobacteriaceae bacterium]
MIKKKVSIKDIAKLTNTSITTVSFVLNGKGRISKSTSQKILDTARQNGYEPSRVAVALRTGKSKVIGLLVENIGGPFFGEIAKIIEEEAEKLGYHLIYCSTNNSVQKGKDLIKMLSQHPVDGYIITPLNGLEKEINSLINNGKPVVLIDGYYADSNITNVLVDNYQAVFNAINCFITAGYKNIGFVTANLKLIQLQDRLKGYQAALKINAIKENEKNIFKLSLDQSKKEMIHDIKSFLNSNKQIDAVFFSTNYLGIMGLQSIRDLKLSIPENMAVISFDDNEIFELYPPGITAIKQPTDEIAKSAIDILIRQLTNHTAKTAGLKIQIPATLIERSSTRTKT